MARDDAGELALLLRKGLQADLLLITGGVSMGKYDLVEQVLASLEAQFFFTGVGIQPGKPVVFRRSAIGRQDYAVLWAAGQSGFDDGDISAVCPAGAGCAFRGEARSRCPSRKRCSIQNSPPRPG